jgi:cupin 2 domain-containing protein
LIKSKNIHDALPTDLKAEVFEKILHTPDVRIERIISKGQTSPEHGWYDQEENEWIMVLQGAGVITFADGYTCQLLAGDYIHIPAHCKHKVSWTDPDQVTIWLAVFYT